MYYLLFFFVSTDERYFTTVVFRYKRKKRNQRESAHQFYRRMGYQAKTTGFVKNFQMAESDNGANIQV